MKWINIKEALPPEDGVYLTYTPADEINEEKIHPYYYSGPVKRFIGDKEIIQGFKFFGTAYIEDKFITHWMALPEAPKDK